MKRIFLAAMLVGASYNATAEWMWIGLMPNPGSLTVYADPTTIRRTGNTSKMWSLHDYKTTQTMVDKKFLSEKTLYEYDCSNGKRRFLHITLYAKNMGSVHITYTGGRTEPWEQKEGPDTLSGSLWQLACSKR